MYKPKSEEWFKERIGKIIFRDDIGCCGTCIKNAKEGLEVRNEDHARYLAMIDSEFGAEGTYCNYRDVL